MSRTWLARSRMARWLIPLVSAVIPAAAVAQSPAPTPMRGMDPRGGIAATMSGDPVLAAVGVVALGIAAAAVTILWVSTVRHLRR